jgi:four helix bundle protein
MTTERTAAQSFRDLVVWQKAHEFVLAIYTLTGSFPRQEQYGLASQMRRAAVSIAANIAEGFRCRGRGDKSRFLNSAQASLEECRYYLILVQDLRYGETAKLACALDEVSRLLSTYATAILNSAGGTQKRETRTQNL